MDIKKIGLLVLVLAVCSVGLASHNLSFSPKPHPTICPSPIARCIR